MGTDTASRAAFELLARAQRPGLHAHAKRLVTEDAEDLVQECLLRAHRSYAELRQDDAAPAWLRSILLNCAKDRYRSARRHPEQPVDPVDEHSVLRRVADDDVARPLPVPFLSAFDAEDAQAVLAALPEMYRRPLVLVHMDGWHTREAAAELGLPFGTLLSRLHRGRKLFARELLRYGAANGLLTGRAVSS